MTNDTDMREFLQRMADEADSFPVDSRPVVRRARRRLAFTVGAALVTVAALVFSAAVGMNGLIRSAPPPPANPRPDLVRDMPDNGEIAVVTSVDGGVGMIDPVTGNQRVLPLSGIAEAAWSPDGAELAYVAESGDVRVLQLSSGASRDVMPCGSGADACSVAWSPDGSRIAVAHDGQLELVSPQGADRTTVVSLGAIEGPSWSPDGERIVFTGEAGRLYVVDRSGSDLEPLSEPPSPDSIGFKDPEWSPDGSKIAYLASDGLSEEKGWSLNVVVVDADGSNPTTVLEAGRCFCLGFSPGLAWSPDGNKMALVIPGPDNGPTGLFVMNADGSDLRLVIRQAVGGDPVWRPVP